MKTNENKTISKTTTTAANTMPDQSESAQQVQFFYFLDAYFMKNMKMINQFLLAKLLLGNSTI